MREWEKSRERGSQKAIPKLQSLWSRETVDAPSYHINIGFNCISNNTDSTKAHTPIVNINTGKRRLCLEVEL